jgi:hypothetical protein
MACLSLNTSPQPMTGKYGIFEADRQTGFYSFSFSGYFACGLMRLG